MPSSASSSPSEYGGALRRPAVLAVLIGVLLAVPWLVPAVPGLLSGMVPGRLTSAPVVVDPPVAPSAPALVPFVPRAPVPSLVGRQLPQAGQPVRLSVERLSVRSAVVPISGNSGVLLPPSDARVLGWWREGAVPGAARGSAVLTGHTVHTGGGAFDHLRALAPDDEMLVRTARGSIRYAVGSVHVYGTSQLARRSGEIFRLDGPGRLVLITCSDWDGSRYLTNTVVVAEPVGRAQLPGGGRRAM